MKKKWGILLVVFGVVGIIFGGGIFENFNLLVLSLAVILAGLVVLKAPGAGITAVVVGLVVAVMLMFGCAAPQSIMRTTPSPNANVGQLVAPPPQAGSAHLTQPQAGLVPVDIQNPSIISHEVFIFEGSATVEIVPDQRDGGWMFNRPAFAKFRIKGANSERSWHEYERIYLPRNTSFVIASRTLGIFGASYPEYYYLRTGPNPGSYEYTLVTPSYPRVYSAGLVTLREKIVSPFGPGPLHIEFTLDARPLGRAITNGLTNAIYGR